MGPSFTSVVLVDHNFKALTDRFLVETTPNDLIFHLKAKVKEERPDELSRYRRSDIRVWKTMGTKAINLSSEDSMPEILSTMPPLMSTTRIPFKSFLKRSNWQNLNSQTFSPYLYNFLACHIFLLSLAVSSCLYTGLAVDLMEQQGGKYCPCMSILASLDSCCRDHQPCSF